MKFDLSVLIPARNEPLLINTIMDAFHNAGARTEVVVGLDGYWPDPPLPDLPNLLLVHETNPIGQRAMTNRLAAVARGEWVMKLDAHCSMEENFDAVLLADAEPDGTYAPVMRNLHAFDWVCEDGHHVDMGPSGPCRWYPTEKGPDKKPVRCGPNCGKPTRFELVWKHRPSPNNWAYYFDPSPHFQYWGDFKKRLAGQQLVSESFSLQGSCFMIRKQRYMDLNICDESWGSWGSQGIEVALKSWLSGGRVLVNHKTHYAHMFRTQDGFQWPYPLSSAEIQAAKAKARGFLTADFPGKVRPFSWLLEHFWPVPTWTEDDLRRIKDAESDLVLHR